MKGLIFIFLLFFSCFSYGQNLTFFFGGQIANFETGKKEGGVTVAIVKSGKIVGSTITGSNGKYILKQILPANSVFDVVVSKPGFVSKKIAFDYTTMDMSTVKEGLTIDPVGALDLDIFTEKPNVDFSFLLTDPVASFKYNPTEMAVRNDAAMSQRVKQKIENLLKQAEDTKAVDKTKYNEAVKAADALHAQAKYAEALPFYEQAAKLDPKETHPVNRIKEIDALLKAQAKEKLAGEQKEKEYANLISAADNLKNQKKFVEAIAKYKEAIVIKSEQYPKDEIKKLETLIAEEKGASDLKNKYDAFIATGDAAFAKKEYITAKGSYENALRLKANEVYPKAQIDKIDKLVAQQAGASEAKTKYDATIAQADNFFKTTKYEEAKAKYKEASSYLPAESYPLERVKLCEDQLSKLSTDKLKTDKVNKLFEEGQKLIDAKKYAEARSKYKEIQALDPTKNLSQVKLDEIDRLIVSDDKEKNKEADFIKFVATADGNIKLGKLEDARQNYGAALEIKEDKVVREKYKKVISDMASTQAKTLVSDRYNTTMTLADKLFDEGKLEEAKVKYKEASVLDDSQAKPKDRLNQIDEMLISKVEEDKKYADFMKKGNQLILEEKYIDAIREYNSALEIKPYENEPKRKAAEAERLEKAKNNEADNQFEKIIVAAKEKIEQKDFQRAEELLKRAQGFRPDDRRPANLLIEIERIRKSEKLYEDKLIEGEDALKANNLAKALAMYSDANRMKPEENLPITKMEEIKRLIGEKSSASQEDKMFNDYFARGTSAMGVARYENALESFKMALKYKPDNKEAKDKIDEINQILEDQTKSNEDKIAQLKEFNDLVKQGDAFFKLRLYDKALEPYSKAKTIETKNQYVNRQIDECKRLLAKDAMDALVKEFNMIVSEGDNLFEQGDLEGAKVKFNLALDKIPGSDYPINKIDEINALLNPVIVKSEELKPLGEKFEGDAELALAKADLERTNQRNVTTDDVRKATIQVYDSIDQSNDLKLNERTESIFEVGTQVREREEQAARDLTLTDTQLKEVVTQTEAIERTMTEMNDVSIQIAADKVSNIENQNEEYTQAQEDRLQNDNAEAKAKIGSLQLMQDAEIERYQKSLQVKGGEVENVINAINLQNDELESETKENQVSIGQTKSIVNAIDDLQRAKNDAFIDNSTQAVTQTIINADNKANADAQIAKMNSLGVDMTTLEVEEANLKLKNQQQLDANTTAINVDKIGDGILVDNDIRDLKREQSALQLQQNQNTLDELAQQDLIKQSEKNYSSKMDISNQEQTIYIQSLETETERKENFTDIERIKASTNQANELLDTKDGLETKKSTLGIDLVEDKVEEQGATTTKKQEQNQGKIFNTLSQVNYDTGVLTDLTYDKTSDQKEQIERIEVMQATKRNNQDKLGRLNQVDVDAIQDQTAFKNEKQAEQNKNKQLSVQSGMDRTTQEVNAANATSNEKQFDNTRKIDVETAYLNSNTTRLEKENNSRNQGLKAKIEKVDSKPTNYLGKNTLGQEYPEGMSEEKFSQNDEKGILKAIITRRVVVVNGHGDVYLRTQTTNNTTYSKNGEPVTEYIWQRETQNGKLKRN